MQEYLERNLKCLLLLQICNDFAIAVRLQEKREVVREEEFGEEISSFVVPASRRSISGLCSLYCTIDPTQMCICDLILLELSKDFRITKL